MESKEALRFLCCLLFSRFCVRSRSCYHAPTDERQDLTGANRENKDGKQRSPPFPLLPPVQTGVLQRSNNELADGTRHHAVVNAVCAVGRAEPGIATQVIGRALDGGCNATG